MYGTGEGSGAEDGSALGRGPRWRIPFAVGFEVEDESGTEWCQGRGMGPGRRTSLTWVGVRGEGQVPFGVRSEAKDESGTEWCQRRGTDPGRRGGGGARGGLRWR